MDDLGFKFWFSKTLAELAWFGIFALIVVIIGIFYVKPWKKKKR